MLKPYFGKLDLKFSNIFVHFRLPAAFWYSKADLLGLEPGPVLWVYP